MEIIALYPMENVRLGRGKKVPRNNRWNLKIYSHFLRLIELFVLSLQNQNVHNRVVSAVHIPPHFYMAS